MRVLAFHVGPAQLQDLPPSEATCSSLRPPFLCPVSPPPLWPGSGHCPDHTASMLSTELPEDGPNSWPVTNRKVLLLTPFQSLGHMWPQGKPPPLPTIYYTLKNQLREMEHKTAKFSSLTSFCKYTCCLCSHKLPIWKSPLSLKLSRFSSILWGLAQAHLLLEASLTTRELPSAEFLQCLYQVNPFSLCMPGLWTID